MSWPTGGWWPPWSMASHECSRCTCAPQPCTSCRVCRALAPVLHVCLLPAFPLISVVVTCAIAMSPHLITPFLCLLHRLANGHLTPGLRWTWFFTSQGLGVLLERGWLGWTDGLGPGDAVTVMMQDSRAFGPSTPYKAGQLVNRAFSWLWTIGFMGFSLHFLWLPPCASPNMAACFIPA